MSVHCLLDPVKEEILLIKSPFMGEEKKISEFLSLEIFLSMINDTTFSTISNTFDTILYSNLGLLVDYIASQK